MSSIHSDQLKASDMCFACDGNYKVVHTQLQTTAQYKCHICCVKDKIVFPLPVHEMFTQEGRNIQCATCNNYGCARIPYYKPLCAFCRGEGELGTFNVTIEALNAMNEWVVREHTNVTRPSIIVSQWVYIQQGKGRIKPEPRLIIDKCWVIEETGNAR